MKNEKIFCFVSFRSVQVFNQCSAPNGSSVEFPRNYRSSSNRFSRPKNQKGKQNLWKYCCVVLINFNSTHRYSSLHSRLILQRFCQTLNCRRFCSGVSFSFSFSLMICYQETRRKDEQIFGMRFSSSRN